MVFSDLSPGLFDRRTSGDDASDGLAADRVGQRVGGAMATDVLLGTVAGGLAGIHNFGVAHPTRRQDSPPLPTDSAFAIFVLVAAFAVLSSGELSGNFLGGACAAWRRVVDFFNSGRYFQVPKNS